MHKNKKPFSAEEDQIIRDNHLLIPAKQIDVLLGRCRGGARQRMKRLGLVVSEEILKKFKESTQMKKGNVPFTKGKKQSEYMSQEALRICSQTRYKKGNLPHNTLFDKAITVRKDQKGTEYKWIRVSAKKWKHLQIYNWEQQHGPVPKGSILRCVDGNTLNCETSNWKLISKAENVLLNSGSIHLPDSSVASFIARGNKDLQKEILKYPELIETKRLQILLNRKIKSKNNKQS